MSHNQVPEFDFSMPQMQMPTWRFWSVAIAGLVGLFIILDGLVSVPAGHVAVLYDRGRGVLERELPEGLHLKIPFWQNATLFDVRLIAANFNTDDGTQIESLTRDGQQVGLDITLQYRLPAGSASTVYQTIGPDYPFKVVFPEARKAIRDEITGFDSNELFADGKRKDAAAAMAAALSDSLADNNIELVDVVLRDVQFSAAYLNSIEEKQIAQQKIQTAQNDLERIKIEKEQKITAAEGEAEAIRLRGDQLQNNPGVIQYELVQKIAPGISWGVLPDGVLPLLDINNVGR